MRALSHLFANNRAWADRIRTEDPEFFARLSRQQAPRSFWIGCGDSRVPANQITGLLPGEMGLCVAAAGELASAYRAAVVAHGGSFSPPAFTSALVEGNSVP